jgi:hypothetical protein
MKNKTAIQQFAAVATGTLVALAMPTAIVMAGMASEQACKNSGGTVVNIPPAGKGFTAPLCR